MTATTLCPEAFAWPQTLARLVGFDHDTDVLDRRRRGVDTASVGALIVSQRAGTVADPMRWDGSCVRVILKPQSDLNGCFIESIVADATAGTLSESNAGPAVVQTTPAARRVDRLVAIQAAFGLPMRTLAKVLQISPPQLYKWFDTSDSTQLRGESEARLSAVEQLARKWGRLTASPLASWVHEPVGGGRTLQDLLTQPELQVVDIERDFAAIVERLAHAPKTRAQRMHDAGFKRRPTHHALPSDE